MKPLDILEWLMTLPAEVWLVPPAIMLAMIFGITLALRRRRLNRWKEIADRTGLRLKPNSIVYAPEVVGDYRRRRLTMTIVSPQRASLGYQRKTWTRVIVAVENPEFISLRMYRQDALDTLMTSLGLADIQAGDDTFDRRFIIQSDEPRLATELLRDEALRRDLIAADIDSVVLYTSELHAHYARDERSVAHAEMLFTAVTRLADGVDALKRNDRPEILHPP